MAEILSAYRGCLLGMAVGDTLGCTVDGRTMQEIREDYGPEGLLGYDLNNGFQEISSHTQVAAFACNGLILSLHRGKTEGPWLPGITQALKEWARAQYFPREEVRRNCWLTRIPAMRRRKCMDLRTLDAMTRNVLGSPEEPANSSSGCGTLTAAVAAGLFYREDRMEPDQIGDLGARTVALTHGDPLAFLSGAVLAYIIAGILQDSETSLKAHCAQAAEVVAAQYGRQFPQARELRRLVDLALVMAENLAEEPWEAMEKLECHDCHQVLAGAVYAAVSSRGDFDRGMITAINHSGRSAAVGAVTGAILGACLGEEELPGFYLDNLPTAEILRELASDMVNGRPRNLFDDDWEKKYTYGEIVEKTGWSTED